ncbi:sterol O-acyltransferase 2-like [Protobothrops mucrosquamatus]|uniref:sterol O-acyltransferase 2-like n=1 Tax=Protobothrops mucrosquamatus TaxID=103944 RepID=UPI0010FAF064|nr:sterol O-acyltransferase 2-like [Protobothrops mucrosquamatus]
MPYKIFQKPGTDSFGPALSTPKEREWEEWGNKWLKFGGEDEHLENVIAHSQWKRHLEVMKVNVLEQVHNQLSDLLNKTLEEAAHSIPWHLRMRFLMKSHSFLRESMPPLLHARDHISPPELSTYLYFLFCPTLIYRKSYPRDPYIRWSYVIQKLVEFLSSIYFVNFLMKYSFIPMFKNMHKQPFTIKILLLSIFDSVVPGITLALMIFYFFLHCWHNMFAEILRFADRSFYKDWWNSRSFSGFFRTWNVIVHDWLYYYIYQDILRLFGGRARGGAMLIVFLLSAVVHEYLLTLVFSMFFPVMFVLFTTIGALLNFILNDKRKNPVWNIIIWICFILGMTTIFSLFSHEWFAHAHCPFKEKTFWRLVTPRSWSCHQ